MMRVCSTAMDGEGAIVGEKLGAGEKVGDG